MARAPSGPISCLRVAVVWRRVHSSVSNQQRERALEIVRCTRQSGEKLWVKRFRSFGQLRRGQTVQIQKNELSSRHGAKAQSDEKVWTVLIYLPPRAFAPLRNCYHAMP